MFTVLWLNIAVPVTISLRKQKQGQQATMEKPAGES